MLTWQGVGSRFSTVHTNTAACTHTETHEPVSSLNSCLPAERLPAVTRPCSRVG